MSHEHVRPSGLMDAASVEAEAVHWLQRKQFWEWSDADQAELDEWLAQCEVHLVTFLRLEAAWTRTERFVALDPAKIARTPVEETSKRPFWPILTRAVAGFTVFAIIGAVAFAFTRPQDRVYSTPVGGHETITFADGSRIELDTNTTIRARMTTEQRMVWLEKGDAFFKVHHDGAHPFIVMAGNRRITDLGTEFLVSRRPHNLRVAVVSGRVWLEAADKQAPSQSHLLLPGDVAVATADTTSIRKKSEHSLANELAWRHGLLVFDHTMLADAAEAFNRYNREKLVIADPAIASITIDGSFQANNLQLFARVVRRAFGLRVETEGDRTVISR